MAGDVGACQLQARLKEEECNIPIIFITAHGDARIENSSDERGCSPSFPRKNRFDHTLVAQKGSVAAT